MEFPLRDSRLIPDLTEKVPRKRKEFCWNRSGPERLVERTTAEEANFMTNEGSIKHLNNVLETLIDSSDGYTKAAEVAERDIFKNFFVRRAAARRTMAAEVKGEIKQLGGEPENEGTILAKAHRMFLTVSAAVQDNDEAAIEAVDTGEEHLRDKIENALKTDDLSVSSKAILSNFQGELRADERLIDYLEKSAD